MKGYLSFELRHQEIEQGLPEEVVGLFESIWGITCLQLALCAALGEFPVYVSLVAVKGAWRPWQSNYLDHKIVVNYRVPVPVSVDEPQLEPQLKQLMQELHCPESPSRKVFEQTLFQRLSSEGDMVPLGAGLRALAGHVQSHRMTNLQSKVEEGRKVEQHCAAEQLDSSPSVSV